MGQWVGPVVYDLERMAERARRLGYQTAMRVSLFLPMLCVWGRGEIEHHEEGISRFVEFKAEVMVINGNLRWLIATLPAQDEREITGEAGVDRLLEAVRLWGFAAMMRANGRREGERRVCHVEAVFKTAKGIQAIAEGDITRAAVCFAQAASWAAEAASKGVPK